MRITDALGKGKGTLSFEIFPPKGDFNRQEVSALLAALSVIAPRAEYEAAVAALPPTAPSGLT